jgi:fimbrial chaperone protein
MAASRAARATRALCLAVTSLLTQAQTATSPPAATPPAAPQINFTPTRLVIAKGQTSTSMLLRNDGGEPMRFQVSASRWSNDPDGQIVLQPTTDVVFFPVLFSVEPGQSRRLRVAVSERAVERELSYRLFIEQLPARSADRSSGVQMLMRASIPIFVQPPSMVARATLDDATAAGGRLSFTVHNIGTVHVSIAQVTVHAPARNAAKPFDTQLPGWYLLSGETRAYSVTLPADLCRQHPTVTIAVTFADNKQALSIDHPIGAGACAP